MQAGRAVVFDVGNVLYGWDIASLYRSLIPDPDELDWFVGHVVTPQWHFQHDAGRPSAETVAELIAAFPDHSALIQAYVPRWLETITGPVPGMLALVEDLAAADVPLFAITNFSAEFWPRFRATAPIFDHFRDIIVSGVEKMMKPDPAIYALGLQRFQLSGTRPIFIDDRADNVEAADAAGYRGLLFTDADRLRADLRAEGFAL